MPPQRSIVPDPELCQGASGERYLAAENLMTWSADFLADDWTNISATQVPSA
jgi:hypothetical protein